MPLPGADINIYRWGANHCPCCCMVGIWGACIGHRGDRPQAGCTQVNSSLSGQNGCHFADDSFRCIFVNEKFCILTKISLKFVPRCPIDIDLGNGLVLNRNQAVILTHWGRVTHICISKLTIIGSDDGLSPGRRQAIIWTNAGILLIGPLGTNFSQILIEIYTFSLKKMHLKRSSAKWRLFRLGLNVLTNDGPAHWGTYAYIQKFCSLSTTGCCFWDNYKVAWIDVFFTWASKNSMEAMSQSTRTDLRISGTCKTSSMSGMVLGG